MEDQHTFAVADLLARQRLSADYFTSEVYVHGILELGLLENRRGDRLIALPETLIKAIYAGLEQETGQASMLVLGNCGRRWGKNFYARFCEELADYHGRPIAELSMAEFIQALGQCWSTHGWGQLTLETRYRPEGFLVVGVRNSSFVRYAPPLKRPICFVEAGILQAFFSQLAAQELACLQTSCESLGDDCNRFILGLEQRLSPVEAWIEQRRPHADIMEELIRHR